ncbi:MAG: peptide deformylase, peptide deformylase [Candidatus Kaiserbacteria bacterium]|nr:peptide deformylase, peptide deformylase [Candidatus Kaiserbacteria bacterium]
MRTIIPANNNPVLLEKARHIVIKDITSPSIQSLIKEMKSLLSKEEHGVALAAPQVGESLQLFIVSDSIFKSDEEDDATPPVTYPLVYINPKILKMSRGKKDKHEGCLSVRGIWGYVPRAEKATIQAYDENGVLFTRGASGLLAHIFQHETDHLQGILYIDKATSLSKDQHAKPPKTK